MKKYLLILSAVSCIAIGYGQAGQKVKSLTEGSLQGVWENTQFGEAMVLTLKPGGKGSFDGDAITYTTTSNTLAIKKGTKTTNYTYQLKEGKCILSGGDLDKPLSFTRKEMSDNTASKVDNGLSGTWTGQNMEFIFHDDGTMIFKNPLTYTVKGNIVTLINAEKKLTLPYEY